MGALITWLVIRKYRSRSYRIGYSSNRM